MTANRMFSSGHSERGALEAVQTTIVGGRPPGGGRAVRNIPRGIEVVVKKASVDPEFRARLLTDRSKAAEAIGLELDKTEAAIIDSLPENSLASMVRRAEVPREQRKAFAGCVAAVMLAAVGASGFPAQDIPVTGILPDRPGIKPILSWEGAEGHDYDVYGSDDLENWSYMATVQGADGLMSYTDRDANWQGLEKRFYKVMQRVNSRGVASDKPLKLEITFERVQE